MVVRAIPSPEHLRAYLERCFPEIKPELYNVTGSEEAMRIVENKCSILNIHVLEGTVKQYNVEEAKTLIDDYHEAVERYCSTSKIIEVLNMRILPDTIFICETVKINLDWVLNKKTIEDVPLLEQESRHSCFALWYLTDLLLIRLLDEMCVVGFTIV